MRSWMSHTIVIDCVQTDLATGQWIPGSQPPKKNLYLKSYNFLLYTSENIPAHL